MKFKQQEETPKNNPFFESIIDLLIVNTQFRYGIESLDDDCWEISDYHSRLDAEKQELIRLAISLNAEHKYPMFVATLEPVESKKDLKTFEEKYYNMLKEIGKNALEQNEIEVVSYITGILRGFKHYFCTLDEDDDSGETSS